mmetsp:Transcript_34632/g.98596  ORF Transcript_34632/g.98596 Transcript_34632/m.98596 type:complete len:157 (+) Transcript_34632:84-554(+)
MWRLAALTTRLGRRKASSVQPSDSDAFSDVSQPGSPTCGRCSPEAESARASSPCGGRGNCNNPTDFLRERGNMDKRADDAGRGEGRVVEGEYRILKDEALEDEAANREDMGPGRMPPRPREGRRLAFPGPPLLPVELRTTPKGKQLPVAAWPARMD